MNEQMNEQNNKLDKITFSNLLIRLIQGLFLGFSNAIPFFQTNTLKEIFHLDKPVFEKEKKGKNKLENTLLGGIRDENPFHCSFLKQILFLLSHRATYFIGSLIGFALFFFIPLSSLTEEYPLAFYSSTIALCIGFGLGEAASIKEESWKRKDFLIAFLILLSSIAISFSLLRFSPLKSFSFNNSTKATALLGVLFFLGCFLFSLCGLSTTSLLFLSGCFLDISEFFRKIVYERNDFKLPLVLIFCSLLGILLAQYLLRFSSVRKQKNSIAIGVYLTVAIHLFITKIKPPFLTDVSTEIAQWITIGMTIAVSLLLPLSLSMHRFSFLNKKQENL